MRTDIFRELYDAKGPFATALVAVGHDNESGAHEHLLRVRAATDLLHEQGAPQDVVDALAGRLAEPVSEPAPVARLAVATSDGVRFDEVAGVRVDDVVATWAPLPDLAAWIARRDASVTFVLALVDHVGGDVSVHRSDVSAALEQHTAGGETEDVNKVSTGGWGQSHVERTSENVWKDNAEAVVEEIASQVRAGHDLVLLGGDPRSVGLVRDGLESVPATVVELASGTRAVDGGEEALNQAIRDALGAQVVGRRVALVHQVQERRGRDYAVAAGIDEVVDAFVRGQVETLLLDPDATAGTNLDPSAHPGLVLGAADVEEPVRTDLALVAAAVMTGAAVAVSPASTLGDVPAAALLRWDQEGG